MTENRKQTTPKMDCHRCRHYYVTWDKNFPHGCRAMSFKAKRLPGATVAESSKMPCLYYEPRENKGKETPQRSGSITCSVYGKTST